MSVYKPKNSKNWHYDFVRNGRRFHGSTGCTTKRAAERVEEQKRAEANLDAGTRKRPPITLDDAAALYEDRLRSTGKWSSTEEYIIVNLIEAIGGNRYLCDVGQADLSSYASRRAGLVAASSVNREIETVRALWNWARRSKRDIGDMPDWGAMMFAVPRKDPRELYAEEEARLFANLRSDMIDVTRFALLSGWRKSEVLGLRWSDLNFPAKHATTRIKGGDVLKRPLTTEMIVILASQPQVGPFVFTYVCEKNNTRNVDKKGRVQPGRRKGERYPMTATALRKPWATAKKLAEIDALRFHDLRHTRATRILRATNNLALAKEALKHRSIKTTLRYAHVVDEDVRNGLEASEKPIERIAMKPVETTKKFR